MNFQKQTSILPFRTEAGSIRWFNVTKAHMQQTSGWDGQTFWIESWWDYHYSDGSSDLRCEVERKYWQLEAVPESSTPIRDFFRKLFSHKPLAQSIRTD